MFGGFEGKVSLASAQNLDNPNRICASDNGGFVFRNFMDFFIDPLVKTR